LSWDSPLHHHYSPYSPGRLANDNMGLMTATVEPIE
jgi:hypothetical protein